MFQNFTAPVLTPVADTFAYQPVSSYLAQTDALQPDALRQEFRTASSLVDTTVVEYVHDTFFSQIGQLGAATGLTAYLTFQPVNRQFIQSGIDAGGSPQGMDISKAPYFWIVWNWTWQDEADDEVVHDFAVRMTQQIDAPLTAWNMTGGFYYLNDAGIGQGIFQSYPPANLARLKLIRAKYDPESVFTKLLSGGWKVPDA